MVTLYSRPNNEAFVYALTRDGTFPCFQQLIFDAYNVQSPCGCCMHTQKVSCQNRGKVPSLALTFASRCLVYVVIMWIKDTCTCLYLAFPLAVQTFVSTFSANGTSFLLRANIAFFQESGTCPSTAISAREASRCSDALRSP